VYRDDVIDLICKQVRERLAAEARKGS
jgi:hypothetical protein